MFNHFFTSLAQRARRAGLVVGIAAAATIASHAQAWTLRVNGVDVPSFQAVAPNNGYTRSFPFTVQGPNGKWTLTGTARSIFPVTWNGVGYIVGNPYLKLENCTLRVNQAVTGTKDLKVKLVFGDEFQRSGWSPSYLHNQRAYGRFSGTYSFPGLVPAAGSTVKMSSKVEGKKLLPDIWTATAFGMGATEFWFNVGVGSPNTIANVAPANMITVESTFTFVIKPGTGVGATENIDWADIW